MRQLPDSHLVLIKDLYMAEELKTSRTYNEAFRRSQHQHVLNVRLDGLGGSGITWSLADPVASEGWGSSQIAMVRRLMPHVRQFIRVRQALVRAQAGDTTVSETDFLNLFEDSSPEIAARASAGYLAAREQGDKRLVLSHTMSDTASNLMVAAKDAVDSYKGLQDNTNVSNTALAQSQIAGTVTQGNLTAAMAQLMAYEAAKEAAKDYEREIARREALSNRVALNQQGEIAFDAHIAGIDANREAMREGMLFPMPGQ